MFRHIVEIPLLSKESQNDQPLVPQEMGRNKDLPRNSDIGTYDPNCSVRGAGDIRNEKTAGER